ncbi:Ras and EF-hand domain-containing protein [Bienertia sinuspersici]
MILPQVVKDFSALETSKPWNVSMHEAFVILDIAEEHRMDTYLAAFLICWLCAFALPLRGLGCIRLSVFKPVSKLASGQRISLAIPILTYIYKGLGELSSSFTPGKQVEHFPAHYVYARLAQYFRSHHMGVHDFVGAPLIAFHGTDAIKTLARKEARSSICSGRSKSQKRKAHNTLQHVKDAKATHDSYKNDPLKIRLTRGSSTCSPNEPAIQSRKGDQSRSTSQSSKDGKSSKDKDRTGLQGDASIVDELRAIHNGFAPIAQELIDVMDDPVTIYEATHIIEETSEIVYGVPWISMGTPSFSARESCLSNAAHSQKKDEEQIQLQRTRMHEIRQRRDELRKELLQSDDEESNLSSSLASSEGSHKKHVNIVKDLIDSHTSLEKDITIAEEAAAKLEEANKGLKDAYDSLKSFKWEP